MMAELLLSVVLSLVFFMVMTHSVPPHRVVHNSIECEAAVSAGAAARHSLEREMHTCRSACGSAGLAVVHDDEEG